MKTLPQRVFIKKKKERESPLKAAQPFSPRRKVVVAKILFKKKRKRTYYLQALLTTYPGKKKQKSQQGGTFSFFFFFLLTPLNKLHLHAVVGGEVEVYYFLFWIID